MTPASGPAGQCSGRRAGPPSGRSAEDLIAALLEVASLARWPGGPLVLDVDAATLRELFMPLLDEELALELAGADDAADARGSTSHGRRSPTATQASPHEPAYGCAAWLIAATVAARWPSGLLLLDVHPPVARDLLLGPLTTALAGACPAAPVTTAVRAPGAPGEPRTRTTPLHDPSGAIMLTSSSVRPVATVLAPPGALPDATCESCCRGSAVLLLSWPDATFRLCRGCAPGDLLPAELLPPPSAPPTGSVGASALQAAR